jgi:hypothetical protein
VRLPPLRAVLPGLASAVEKLRQVTPMHGKRRFKLLEQTFNLLAMTRHSPEMY